MKVAVAEIKGEKPLIELEQDVDVQPNQIKQWKERLLVGASEFFSDAAKAAWEPVNDVKTL